MPEGSVGKIVAAGDEESAYVVQLATDLASALDIAPSRVVFKSTHVPALSGGGVKRRMTFEILGGEKADALVKELNTYKAKSLGKQLSASYAMNIVVRVNSQVEPPSNIYDTINLSPPETEYKNILERSSPTKGPNSSFNARSLKFGDHAMLPEQDVSSLLQQRIACEFQSSLEQETNCVAARGAAARAKDCEPPHDSAAKRSQMLEGSAQAIEGRVRSTLQHHELLQHCSDVSDNGVKDPRSTLPQISQPQPTEVSGTEHAAGVWQRKTAAGSEHMLQSSPSKSAETTRATIKREELQLQLQAKERQLNERKMFGAEMKIIELKEKEGRKENERDLEEERKRRLILQEKQTKILELRFKLEQKVAARQMVKDMHSSPRAADLQKSNLYLHSMADTGANIVQCQFVARS